MHRIDFRRDTITLPSTEMEKMAFSARLGDSVYDEDPNQRELEVVAAEKTDKEEAIFVPSGTMGNLIALLCHTRRGDEIIIEANAHILLSETGGAACVAGLMLKTVEGRDGVPDANAIERSIRTDDIHYPRTSLICLENTHYRYGGIVPPLDRFREIRSLSKKYGIPIHLDGARVFNASVHLGIDVNEITRLVDSVMISLSKGLGAPVGSVLCGSSELITRAKRYRKMLGGGMRQTGWLCACGLIALSDSNINKLKTDHDNARILAKGLKSLEGVNVNLERTHTNFVIAHFLYPRFDATEFLNMLAAKEIYVTLASGRALRFVTSREVSRDDIKYTIEIIKELLLKNYSSEPPSGCP